MGYGMVWIQLLDYLAYETAHRRLPTGSVTPRGRHHNTESPHEGLELVFGVYGQKIIILLA